MAKHVLTIGRIVHVTNPDRPEAGPSPAIVTRVYSKDAAGGGTINCLVFEDIPANEGVVRRTSVSYDPTGATLGTWHWPDEARPEEPQP